MPATDIIFNEYARQIDNGVELTYESFEKQYRDEWMQGLNLAYRYYIFHNSLDVPRDYSIDGFQLGHWIESQRKSRRDLTTNQFQLLDDINMKWSVRWDHHLERAKREIKYGEEQYAKWIEHLLQAKTFFEENGHLDIPVGYKVTSENGKPFNLYAWILQQRHNYRTDRIPAERMSKLDSYFMIYDFTHKEEMNRILEVQDHFYLPEKYRGIDPFAEEELVEIFGEDIDQTKEETIDFESMVAELENEINSYFDQQTIAEIKEPKTKESISEKKWKSKLEYARAYYESHGHLLIPRSEVIVLEDGTEVKIGLWIGNQRTMYKNGKMPEEKIEALESIGMVWDPRIKAREIKKQAEELSEVFGTSAISQDERWNNKYEYAKAYYETHGHLLMPKKEVLVLEDGTEVKIGAWLHNQRVIYKSNKMPAERLEALEEIGMVWSPRLEGKTIATFEKEMIEETPVETAINDTPIIEEPTIEERIDSLSIESLKELEDSITSFYEQLTSIEPEAQFEFELGLEEKLPLPSETPSHKQKVISQNKK